MASWCQTSTPLHRPTGSHSFPDSSPSSRVVRLAAHHELQYLRGGASACRCGGLNHMARYCTAVKKEKKESGKAQNQEGAVALLVHMENGKEDGIMRQLRKSDPVDITRLYV